MNATRFIISGRVQGVGYREWCRREAESLGLSGTVRNLPDGTVEAVFIGDSAAVDAMLTRCRKGPPAAEVVSIGLDPVDMKAVDGFVILPSG
ncbi:acylphosphatase [Acuticoccus sp. M5D2P5]|uniref:acylphosphatase n=1 Tax=Acuticoccus kalidii TaxID=2910977 RepID=UPI001F2E8704|nr:acylphosphatase [Acuticoccus kalidii]MCF3936489.1 acylphosphatase [Acuticoccus kalidii]